MTAAAVVAIDTSDAERRALKIGLRLDAIADNYEAVMPMIREALDLGDHLALGYRSPGEYLADRFGAALARLPIPVRREAVKELTSAGLSTRAIAPIVGASIGTVHADRQVFSSEHLDPGPAVVGTGVPSGTPVDGQPQAADTGLSIAREMHDLPPFDPTTGEVLDDGPQPERTTGLDRKSYPKHVPTRPRRKPLVDALRPKLGRIWLDALDVVAFVNDDRFAANKALLSTRFLGETRAALVALADFVAALEPQAETEEARNRLVADLDHISETCQRLARTLTEDPK